MSALSAQIFRFLWFMPSLGVSSPCAHQSARPDNKKGSVCTYFSTMLWGCPNALTQNVVQTLCFLFFRSKRPMYDLVNKFWSKTEKKDMLFYDIWMKLNHISWIYSAKVSYFWTLLYKSGHSGPILRLRLLYHCCATWLLLLRRAFTMIGFTVVIK